MERDLLWDITHGLYIVSSHMDGKFNGQIVDSLCQVCNHPPMIAVSIHKDNLTHKFISDGGVFAVTILADNAPTKFISHFGLNTGHTFDKFDEMEYELDLRGCPIVPKYALGCMEVEVLGEMDMDSHTLFIGEVVDSHKIRNGEPLTYREYRKRMKGLGLSTKSPLANRPKQ